MMTAMDPVRIKDYILSLSSERDSFLSQLRAEAERDRVPIIREETEEFLKTLIKLKAPSLVLEIGTAIAYSTIVMARSCDAGIVTMENYQKRIERARDNIMYSGLSDRIRLMEGDAGELLRKLPEEAGYGSGFDLIFLDAAKGQYINWLPDIKRLMNRGSLLIADNVLQDMTVMESRFTVERRERTTHKRMRDFLYAIKHDPELSSSVIPIGDGVSLSVKI